MRIAQVLYKGQHYQVTIDKDDVAHANDISFSIHSPEVKFLPPCRGTMFALAINYADHASELAFNKPTEPLVFLKSNNTLAGHDCAVVRPLDVTFMHYECELVVVIGKDGKHISEADAFDYVQGYTVCNDYALRDYLENYYRPNLRIKCRDGCTPIGPWIVTKDEVLDPHNLKIKSYINGELKQEGCTSDLIFNIPYLISYLSSFMTLKAGDMIATGTPKGVVDCTYGDVVEVEVEGIGKVRNTIVKPHKEM